MLRQLIILITVVISMTSYAWSAPKYVIFMIGDGMGHEQVKAAGMYEYGYDYGTEYENGSGETIRTGLSFESLTYTASVKTFSADESITDSAAGATAMATGTKVNNGVISIASPGNDEDIQTILEYYAQQGKSTGLVTTTAMTNATPAAFGAHVSDRTLSDDIAHDYVNKSRPNILFGGGDSSISNYIPVNDNTAQYDVVTDLDSLNNYRTLIETNGTVPMVSGQFGSGKFPFESDFDYVNYPRPHLSEMAHASLNMLDNDADGFFLMIEGGLIDRAGHKHEIIENIYETLEFSLAVQEVIDWVEDQSNGSTWDNTLLIVTADHETGGLSVEQNNGTHHSPDVTWYSDPSPYVTDHWSHTNATVPAYAKGVNADLVEGVLNNTDLFYIAKGETPPTSLANTSILTDLASWEAEVTDIETFVTKADNIVLADEVLSLSEVNDKIGSILTFDSYHTGLTRSFNLETLQSGAEFTFNDHEGGVYLPNFTDALSVGDNDDFEDDNWKVSLENGSITAIGFEIRGSKFAPYESITLYADGSPIDTISLQSLAESGQGNYFIGIISDIPFDSIEFDEDNTGDDIAIADFRFATAGAPIIICTDNDSDGFSIQGGSCGSIDCNDADTAVNPDMPEIQYNGKDDDCDTLTVDDDIDGDGYLNAIDCNDNNPLIHPGAEETCNGIDDNCDHAIDNGLQAVLNDNQNGVCAGSLKICNGLNGWVNDYSHTDYFEQDELTCSDGADNDCDGVIDESDNCSYMELTLTVGWNMISLPLAPSDTSIDNVLSSIAGKYNGVWAYNETWKIYDPDSPSSDLSTMEAGKGYWIYMTEEASLTITGSIPSSSITLKSGWNLVGYNSLRSEEVTEALSSIDDKYTSVWVYKNGSWMKHYSDNSALSDLTTMEPGYGYWIKMTEDATLTLE